MFDGFGVMEGIVFGVLGLLTGLCGFVVMARRAGIIPDPKEQAQLLVNLQKALNDSASTSQQLDQHESECTNRYDSINRMLGDIRDRLARIEGQLSK